MENEDRKPCLKPCPPNEVPWIDKNPMRRVYLSMSPKETICGTCEGVVPPFVTCICYMDERDTVGGKGFNHEKKNGGRYQR